MSASPEIAGRLHPLAVVVYGWQAVRVIGLVGLISLIGGRRPELVALVVLGAAALAAPFAWLAWRRFRYRVGGGSLEVTSGVLVRSVRTIPLARVRGVDVSAPPLHRALGLVRVRVDDAAGGPRASGLRLAAVTRRQAEELRAAVLHEGAASPPSATTEPPLARARTGTLALAGATSGRYLAVPAAALGTILNVADEERLPWVRDLVDAGLGLVPTDPAGAAVVGLAALALAAALAAAGSVIVDGGFALTASGRRLIAERGLLARRSVSLDRARVRALELRDSPPWRVLGLASLRAIVGGVPAGEGDATGRTTLLPAGRREEAWALTRRLDPAAHARLDPHPRSGLRRRLARACAPPAAGAAIAALLGAPAAAVGLGALALAMAAVAVDRHRQLGSRVDGGRLGLREGSLVRRHAIVDPGGLVAYRLTESPFQRRAGLATLTVFLGQGAGSRRALDAGRGQAVDLLVALAPELVGPLRARPSHPGAEATAPQPGHRAKDSPGR